MDENITEFYKFDLVENDTILINWKNLIRAVAKDVLEELPIPVISAKFHNSVANLILDLSFKMREKFQIKQNRSKRRLFSKCRIASKSNQTFKGKRF